MTRDEIIRMAREAGAAVGTVMPDGPEIIFPQCMDVERFATLVAAAEREACAKFVEEEYVRQFDEPWRQNLAAAIRARGQA